MEEINIKQLSYAGINVEHDEKGYFHTLYFGERGNKRLVRIRCSEDLLKELRYDINAALKTKIK